MEEIRWKFFRTIEPEELSCFHENADFGLIPDNFISKNIHAFIENIGAENTKKGTPEIPSDSVLKKASDIFIYMNFNPCNNNVSKWIRKQFLIILKMKERMHSCHSLHFRLLQIRPLQNLFGLISKVQGKFKILRTAFMQCSKSSFGQ